MKLIVINFRSDYRAYGSCLLTTVIYALTQLAKIIFLASLFPNTEFSGPISLWNVKGENLFFST